MNIVDISVIICTYNRSKSLKRTLGSVAELSTQSNLDWELIVVDNNSKDNTKDVVEQFKKSCCFCVRYIFEEKQGLSYARNRGIKESTGKLIAFTDDDVLVNKYWLINILKVFEKYDVSCIGGKILPIWEKPKPNWLSKDLYGNLALLDYGERPFYLDKPLIWGANLVVKKSIFEEYGVFNTALGRIPGKLFGFEETEFLKTLIKNGERILYVPDVLVYHCIPEERISKSYFRKWRFNDGELKARLAGELSSRKFLNTPLDMYRITLSSFRSYAKAVLLHHSDAFLKELRFTYYLGFIYGRVKLM